MVLTGCNIPQGEIQLTKEEKNYINELKARNQILNCQPTIDEIERVHSELCRKSGVQKIGVDVVF